MNERAQAGAAIPGNSPHRTAPRSPEPQDCRRWQKILEPADGPASNPELRQKRGGTGAVSAAGDESGQAPRAEAREAADLARRACAGTTNGAGVRGGGAPRVGPVLGLRLPADVGESVAVVLVRPTAAALSDTVGGGLLDDGFVGSCEGGRYGVYLDAERVGKGLPPNDRAAVLSVRLGHTDRQWLADLRGDVLLVGVSGRGGDCDVPAGVLVAACHGGQAVSVEMPPVRCRA